MTKFKELVSKERSQYRIFIGLSLVVAVLTGILYFSDNHIFQRFFGDLSTLLIIVLIILLGFILLSFLLSRGWFVIYNQINRNGLLLASGLAILFALPTILVDISVRFPEDLNILFPQSVLFYPAIAYVVEVLFHLLPLSVLLILLTSIFNKVDQNKVLWFCIPIVSLLEQAYQTIGFIGQYPLWTVIYVGLHVFLFNVVQLSIFKRYDFISMYSFRLVYYILWHMVWGYARLQVLF